MTAGNEPAAVGARADQFSLAAIAYRLLSGRDAFAGATVGNLLNHVLHDAPKPLSAIGPCDPMVEAVVMRGLAKQPQERWETVLDFASAFEQAALSGLPVLTQTVSRSQVVADSPLPPSGTQAVPATIAVRPTQGLAQAPTVRFEEHQQQPAQVGEHVKEQVHEQVHEEVHEEDDQPDPFAQADAAAADELSERFFAEGEQQERRRQQGLPSEIRPAPRRATPEVSRPRPQSPYRSYHSYRSGGDTFRDVEPFESHELVGLRIPRRRWPARLLLLTVLGAAGYGYWRSNLPYAAEVRAEVRARAAELPLPALLTR
jgi:hypothetical protein